MNKNNVNKGQVSIELIVIVGFILLFFIPVLLFSYFQISDMNKNLGDIQANVAVTRIANTINTIGRMGVGSSVILDVYLPRKSTLNFKKYTKGGEIVLDMGEDYGQVNEVVGVSWFKLEPDTLFNNLKGGINYRFNITSTDSGIVKISSVQ